MKGAPIELPLVLQGAQDAQLVQAAEAEAQVSHPTHDLISELPLASRASRMWQKGASRIAPACVCSHLIR